MRLHLFKLSICYFLSFLVCRNSDQMLRLHELMRMQRFDRYIARNVKNRSRLILRLWAEHCEYILAQRFRRGQQMVCLYRRIWDENALRHIIQQFRKQVGASIRLMKNSS